MVFPRLVEFCKVDSTFFSEQHGFKHGSAVHSTNCTLEMSSLASLSCPSFHCHQPSNVKHCVIAPRVGWMSYSSNKVPQQTHFSHPNGFRWQCCPLTSIMLCSPSINLSSWNLHGSTQQLGSLLSNGPYVNEDPCVHLDVLPIDCPVLGRLSLTLSPFLSQDLPLLAPLSHLLNALLQRRKPSYMKWQSHEIM